MRVKICGLTRPEDARRAVLLGADAIGLVFARSPRRVTASQAKKIIENAGPFVSAVGVFVNEKPERIERIARECHLAAVQLHGDETPSIVKKLSRKGIKVVKAFCVGTGFRPGVLRRYSADAFLFDAKVDSAPRHSAGLSRQMAVARGGTGKVFDWRLLKKISRRTPIIISGGLNASNVKKAVRFFRPYAVDVSSGIEKSPGVKSAALMKKFIQNVKAA